MFLSINNLTSCAYILVLLFVPSVNNKSKRHSLWWQDPIISAWVQNFIHSFLRSCFRVSRIVYHTSTANNTQLLSVIRNVSGYKSWDLLKFEWHHVIGTGRGWGLMKHSLFTVYCMQLLWSWQFQLQDVWRFNAARLLQSRLYSYKVTFSCDSGIIPHVQVLWNEIHNSIIATLVNKFDNIVLITTWNAMQIIS